MFDDIEDDGAGAALGALHDAVTALITLAGTNLPGTVVLDVLRAVQTETNRLAVADHAFIAELESQGTAREHACRNTTTLLTQLLRIHPLQAGARVNAATYMAPRRGLSGQVLPPVFEKVAAAQASGVIDPAHARVVTQTIKGLHETVRAENEDWLRESLVQMAYEYNPAQLGAIARNITYLLNQDGEPPNDAERNRRRELRIRHREDGTGTLSGELTAMCAEALLTVLDSLGKPRPARDGTPDPRTTGQRQHDALYYAMLQVLRSELLPDCGGVAATIVLTMTAEQFHTGQGLVRTGHGAHLPVDEALTLFGDCRIIPVVLGKAKEITAYGTTHRIFTEGQRLAMIARDQGCSFPACPEPPTRCQAHHITDYSITRRTSVDDGTLLCGMHHREHPTRGWRCHMITAPHTGPHHPGSTPPKPRGPTAPSTYSPDTTRPPRAPRAPTHPAPRH